MYAMELLGDLCNKITDGTHQSPEFTSSGVAFLFSCNVVNGKLCFKNTKFISEQTMEILTKHSPIEIGDVLYTAVGSYGRAAVVQSSQKLAFQRHIAHLKPKFDVIEPGYLRHFLNSPHGKSQADRVARGAAQKTVTLSDLKKFQIPVPALGEQRRIGAILDRADAIRGLRREVHSQIGELRAALFRDMFGTRQVAQWPKFALGGILTFLTSGSRGWASFYASTGDVFLRIQNVRRDGLSLDDLTYVRPPNTAESRRTLVQAGDVLLSITADLGRTAVVPASLGRAYINQHLAILRQTELNPVYLSAFLASVDGQEQIARMNKNGVKAGLNFDDIRSMQVPAPPRKLQDRYAERCREVVAVQCSCSAAAAGADALFASLQHRAFRGEL